MRLVEILCIISGLSYCIVVSDGVHIQFVLLMYLKHNGMSSTKIIILNWLLLSDN